MGVVVCRTHIQASRPQHIVPRPAPERIQRQQIPYWQERGWVRQGARYRGTYQTTHGSFRGLIEDRGYGSYRFYLLDIPPALRQSSHWACFQPRGAKGFKVHMARRPHDISSGIVTIERLLADVLDGR